ncbi:MAG TPA: glutamine synthetase adenylyltransferase, partial [Anaerolineae bacterium]|nr:glutamine synthetase adenylyltransferase [Anaerolineae bacterium]
LVAHHNLSQVKTRADFETRIAAEIAPHPTADARLDALRRFQRWQYLRIGTCDLLGLFDMPTVTEQLSRLADALVQTALQIVAADTGISPAGFAVLAMGKLGGEELNYSSDIDLLFISDTAAERYLRLGKRLIDALTRVTAEGFLYRVDMRLRPWGKVGALVTSVPAYLAYLHQNARLWEKQALLKARTIAGDEPLGSDFLRQIAPLIFAADAHTIQTDVRAMKTRIESNLRKKGRGWGEVKLGAGSIRDIEFLTQYLQLAHGDTHPDVRSQNTLDGLARLTAHGFLSADEHRILSEGYTFLRSVEHWLQMLHFRQTHTLPTDPAALTALAQRLGFAGENAGAQLVDHYTRHTEAIRAVYRRHFFPEESSTAPKPDSPVVQRHLARLAPAYATTFTEPDIARHAALAGNLRSDRLAEVDARPLADNRWQVTVVAFDYLGELSLICGLFFAHGFDIHGGNVFTYRPPAETAPDRRRKIVDVFVVSPTAGQTVSADLWQQYAADLQSLLDFLERGESDAAQGKLAERLAGLYRRARVDSPRIYPIDIEIDNTGEPHRTVLRIDTVDTVGFLYELTNALAMAGVHIARMSIGTAGKRVSDMLHITDARGKKITDPQKLRELRATIVLTKHFTHLLPRSPNPAAALVRFRQFLSRLFARPNWTEELVSLEQPKVLSALTQLLGVSDFLWTDFLRMQYENLFPVLRNSAELATRKTKGDLQAELSSLLAQASTDAERVQVLNAFKDREMFRIDMRHILRYITVSGQFSAELTDLAEVVVAAAFNLCRESLVARYGEPQLADGSPCAVSVC